MQNQQILARINQLEQELRDIKKLLAQKTPSYGSDAWWIKEVGEGEAQIKKKQFKVYENAQGMIADLHKGKWCKLPRQKILPHAIKNSRTQYKRK